MGRRPKNPKDVEKGGGTPDPSSPCFVGSMKWHPSSTSRTGFERDKGHLTLTQEARNTERYTTRRSYLKLRYNEVQFVSAGDMLPGDLSVLNHQIKNDPASDQPNAALSSTDPVILGQSDVNGHCQKWLNGTVEETMTGPDEEAARGGRRRRGGGGGDGHEESLGERERGGKGEESGVKLDVDTDSTDIFFIDREGEDPQEHLEPKNPATSHNTLADAQLDSSEDEVVFTGRGKSFHSFPAPCSENLNTINEREFCTGHESSPGKRDKDGQEPVVSEPAAPSDNESDPIIIHTLYPALCNNPANQPEFISLGGNQKRSHARNQRKPNSQWNSDESEVLADYIANMTGDHSSEEGEDKEEDAGVRGINAQSQTHHDRRASWSSADLENLNDLSSSDELPDEVSCVFSMRERNQGIQYLLVGVGESTDEARWIGRELLTMPGAAESIKRFEEKVASIESSQEMDSDSSSSNEMGEEDKVEEFEPHTTEQQLDMTDEQMARLLQTQGSFGLGTNDLLLYDENDAVDGFEKATRSQFSYTSVSKLTVRRNRAGHFPSASALANALEEDPYGGIDAMAFDRPRLKNKLKGRRHAHQQDFGLSDSDMARELHLAWENDRKKKKTKRQEREEQRSGGLLGTGPGKVDLKAKYPHGMTLDNVKDEIRNFLASPYQSLTLPPMDRRNRKFVHEISHSLSLNSISRGSGAARFPILTKTANTPDVEGNEIGHVERLFFGERFLRRTDRRQRGSGGPNSAAQSRGASVRAASYMDGDIVGASAPEIGAENKGRAMLERMGWSSGTALGAANNKGILHPVVHVVKNTKAGLG
ncbi:hypothetical protein PAAG_08920 [Paracoccidioides lutzii Pb01]|uniref:Protein SQS1 n=1 Tax=Paracoccidioides lutzii (strain ATCC MYA-826 / Pb01) TaxID=502779 RepID=C1HDS7_PARBA|nr:hypothetical protein PAAG_08920 [Paracoccidioides lutzii Pb01]EEH40071.1 hypothetical protein PAAG_08920 [Paracoccidioides lutzii Pb01]